MKALLVSLLLSGIVVCGNGQTEQKFRFPYESGMIRYEYSGSTEGFRELFFSDFGARLAIHTDLVHSTSFYSVTTKTPELVSEYLYEDNYYFFDLQLKKGYIIDQPLHLFNKYVSWKKEIVDPEDWLEEQGAIFEGEELLLDKRCRIWKYKNKDFWMWNGILLKMVSRDMNKKFALSVVSMNFNDPVPEEKLRFPADIVIPVIINE